MKPVTRITLRWAKTSELSANSRLHWSRKAKLIAAQKAVARGLALEAGWHKFRIPADGPIAVRLTFCPPSARRFDLDNALSSMKAALDQMAATLGVDDALFVPTIRRGEKCKLGGVIVDAEVVMNDLAE